MKLPVYMDSNATTPVDPRVLEAMMPYFTEHFGNAASKTHSFGWKAEEAVETARRKIAALINAKPREIIFTGGATESNNLAIRGIAEMYRYKGNHIITAQTEHKSVLNTCERLKTEGFEVTVLPVDKYGLVDPDDVRSAITGETILVTIMTASNEIGTIAPVKEIGAVARERSVLFHTDAAQAAGKIPFDVEEMNIDLASITAHKMYGPKGTGALYVRHEMVDSHKENPRVKLKPIINGGGHEGGMCSGTLNVPGIVGFGTACEICQKEMPQESKRLIALRDRLYNAIAEKIDEVYLNGHPVKRLPNNLNLAFLYAEGQSILMDLKNIAFSSGSACNSAKPGPSYVLMALGIGEERAFNSVRFGLHRFNTEEEVDYVAEEVIKTVKKLRQMSPLYMLRSGGSQG
ncbi:cysteine desulfurase IscS [bacterium SM23_31]|nr:MAG: cysteine desulfurase IscS [bacterium SM23_31]